MEEVEDREDNLYLERIFQSSPERCGDGQVYVNRRMTMRFDVTMAKINEIIRLKDEEEEAKERALQQQQQSLVLQTTVPASSSTAATIKSVPPKSQKTKEEKEKPKPFVVPGRVKHNDMHLLAGYTPPRLELKKKRQFAAVQSSNYGRIPVAAKAKTAAPTTATEKPSVAPAALQSTTSSSRSSKQPIIPPRATSAKPSAAVVSKVQVKTKPKQKPRVYFVKPKVEVRLDQTFGENTDDVSSPSLFYPESSSPSTTSSSQRPDSLISPEPSNPQDLSTYLNVTNSTTRNPFCHERTSMIPQITHVFNDEEEHGEESEEDIVSEEEQEVEVPSNEQTPLTDIADQTTVAVADYSSSSQSDEEKSPPSAERPNDLNRTEVVEKSETAGFLREEWLVVTSRLESQCHLWENILEREGDQIPEEENGSVLTVIQQTKLLQDQKCKMYFDLIDQFDKGTGENPIYLSDLESFKELVQQQVDDLDRKFENLDELRKNGWVHSEPFVTVHAAKKGKKNKKKKPIKLKEDQRNGTRTRFEIFKMKKKLARAPLNGASPFLKSVSTESLEACGVGIETASTSEESSSSAVRPTPAFRRILCRKKHKSGSASPLPYPPLFPSCHTTPEGRPRSCTTGSTPSVRLEFPFSHLISNSRDSSSLDNPKKPEMAEENNNNEN